MQECRNRRLSMTWTSLSLANCGFASESTVIDHFNWFRDYLPIFKCVKQSQAVRPAGEECFCCAHGRISRFRTAVRFKFACSWSVLSTRQLRSNLVSLVYFVHGFTHTICGRNAWRSRLTSMRHGMRAPGLRLKIGWCPAKAMRIVSGCFAWEILWSPCRQKLACVSSPTFKPRPAKSRSFETHVQFSDLCQTCGFEVEHLRLAFFSVSQSAALRVWIWHALDNFWFCQCQLKRSQPVQIQ